MPTEQAQSLDFAQDDLAVAVHGGGADLAWLAEFMGPGFERRAGLRPGARLRLTGDAPRPAPAPPARTALAFAFDSGPMRLTCGPAETGLRLCDHDAGLEFHVQAVHDVTVRFWGSRAAARVRLMRVLREYFHNQALRGGRLVLHAAAVVHSGRAVAIAGRKGAGKTTAMLRLLEHAGAAYLSNDRVLVDVGPSPLARGVPSVVALRDGTLRLAPRLSAGVRAAGDFRLSAHERRSLGPTGPVVAESVVRLSPAQVCQMTGRPMAAQAPLAAVVFIEDGAPGAGRLRLLDPVAAAGALAAALVGAGTGTYVSDVFVASPGGHPTQASLEARCAALACVVPCYVTGQLGAGAAAVLDQLQTCPAPVGA